MQKSGFSKSASQVAVPAVFAALAVLFLYLSGMVPTGRWAVTAVAGLCPAAVVVSVGLPAGCLTYAAAGILGFLLAPDKGNVLLFLLFFGLYPIVKFLIERIHVIPLELLCKLLFFNGVLTLFVFGFAALFLAALPEWMQHNLILLYLAGNAVFLIYDLGFTKLMWFYKQRIDKVVHHSAGRRE